MAVSVREVAAMASVSVGTVSNVLNRPEKVAPDTVARVLAAIDQLGFVRNDAARQLRAGRSRSIGLVVLDVRNPFFTEVARGAEDRAAEDSMTILLGNSDENADRERSYLDLFEEQRVHGVLISPLGDDETRLQRLRARETPVVLVDRVSEDRSLSSVSVDDVVGGELAVRHLLDTGRRRIAFVGGPTSIRQVADRLTGARRAVGTEPGATLEVIETESLTVLDGRCCRRGDPRPVGGRAPRRGLRRERPARHGRAPGAEHDGVAPRAPRTSRSSATTTSTSRRPPWCRSPRSASPPRSSATRPSTSSSRRPPSDGGSTPEQVVFQPELVVRASTRA